MEEYKFVERTNYFKVNNVESLKNLVQNIKGAALLENANGEFAIAGYSDIENVYDEGNDEIVDIAVLLKPLLEDGVAVLFTKVGHKAYASVVATGRIITNKDDEVVTLTDMMVNKARRLLKDSHKEFYMEY